LTEQFVIGVVGSSFGLEGFVKVKPFSGDIENLLRLREVTLRRSGTEQKLTIAESAAAPPVALIRFTGVTSPEAAKALNGAEIIVGRSLASPLYDGEFYIEDLKGLAVVSGKSGDILGRITDVVEGGAADLVEVRLESGDVRLVPFRTEFFSGIYPDRGTATLNNCWILE
jgi:16S rRNA processing protein RimM